MNNILLDISGKIDAATIEALSAVKSAADSLEIPFFIVGASARDFILEHFYNIKASRMTADIDLAMKVTSWEQYHELESALITSGKFKKDMKRERFNYNTLPIDILPFGEISGSDNKIIWPPEDEIIMSVLGFDEVYTFSTTITLRDNPVLEIKIPTLSGLAVLKMLSWKEKYPERKKDAHDILFIMNNYEYAGNFDRLYEDEIALLESEDFDSRLAGIRLLGKDMAAICNHNTLDTVKRILTEETENRSYSQLAVQMNGPNDNYEDTLILLIKLKDGIFDN